MTTKFILCNSEQWPFNFCLQVHVHWNTSMSVIHAVVQVNDLLALMIFEVLGQPMRFGDFNAPDQFQPFKS